MNKGELRAKLQTWSKLASGADVPWDDCIDMAYDAVSRDIHFQHLDEELLIGTENAQQGDGQVWQHALPADYNGIWRVTNNGPRLRRYSPDALKERHGRSAISVNRPSGYAVVGSKLWTAPGAGGNLRIIYHKRDAKPVADTDTNIGMTQAPFAYLWAGLVAVHEFMGDDVEADRAGQKYQGMVDRVNEQEEDKRLSGAGRAA